MTPRSIAVVPFGAKSGDPRAGAWGRQLARRLVDRFAGHPDLELKPVFLVAMPEDAGQPGYLVFGSTPDAALAAQYGASLGATHALVGLLVGGRRLEVDLVDVAAKRVLASFARAYPEGTLHEAEQALGAWLAHELGTSAPPRDADSIRLAELYVEAGAEATARSRLRRIKPGSDEYAHAQDVLGVLAAQHGDLAAARTAFDRAVDAGTRDGAIFARLAQVQAAQGDTAGATATFERAAGATDPSWELSAAHGAWLHGNGDLDGAISRYRDAVRYGAPLDVRLGLARALVAEGARDAAATELEAILRDEQVGEIAAHARRLLFGLRRRDLEERL